MMASTAGNRCRLGNAERAAVIPSNFAGQELGLARRTEHNAELGIMSLMLSFA
jgi:hypothetical protein